MSWTTINRNFMSRIKSCEHSNKEMLSNFIKANGFIITKAPYIRELFFFNNAVFMDYSVCMAHIPLLSHHLLFQCIQVYSYLSCYLRLNKKDSEIS